MAHDTAHRLPSWRQALDRAGRGGRRPPSRRSIRRAVIEKRDRVVAGAPRHRMPISKRAAACECGRRCSTAWARREPAGLRDRVPRPRGSAATSTARPGRRVRCAMPGLLESAAGTRAIECLRRGRLSDRSSSRPRRCCTRSAANHALVDGNKRLGLARRRPPSSRLERARRVSLDAGRGVRARHGGRRGLPGPARTSPRDCASGGE